MSNGSAVTEKQPTYCKWCGRVEITFSDAFKSKSGKFIPIEKASGVPHKCTANPNNQQQQQQQQSGGNSSSSNQAQTQQQPKQTDYDKSLDNGISAFSMMTDLIRLVEQTQKQMITMNEKLDRLLNLAEIRK